MLQNSRDRSRPITPATIRMMPTVLMLKPSVVTLTAKVRMAPITSRKMLAPMLIAPPSRQALALRVRPTRSGPRETPDRGGAARSAGAVAGTQLGGVARQPHRPPAPERGGGPA